jgi:hypothetical protein
LQQANCGLHSTNEGRDHFQCGYTVPSMLMITVQVFPDSLRDVQAGRGSLVELVNKSGLRLVPMDPGAPAESLKRYFLVSVPGATALESILEQIRACPSVEAAYVKPRGEPPE